MSALKKILFSTRLMAVLFIVFAAAMGVGTFVESKYSTETARIWIYNAWWFETIMAFFLINFLGNIFRYKLLRKEKWAVLLLHLAFIFILLGAFITRYISYEGVMPIQEGATENFFFSEKTYLTAFVDGDIDNTPKRRTLEESILVTTEGLKSKLPWHSDFNGQPFTIAYKKFISGAEKGLVPDKDGETYLKLVEAGGGKRHEHYLKSGEVASVHNILFALNKPTKGAININTTVSPYTIETPFKGKATRMRDQKDFQVLQDSVQPLHLRSLYQVAEMLFVLPEPPVKGKYQVVPAKEKTDNTQDALVVTISSKGEEKEIAILGSKGQINDPVTVKVGGLEFHMAYGSKKKTLPFSIKLNDFIADKYPGTLNSFSSFKSKITVQDTEAFDYDIYMNHVLDHKGYRFFQASYNYSNQERRERFDPDITYLSVNHDFWGTNITYLGYFLLYIGLVGIMFFGKTRFKTLGDMLEKIKKKKASLLIAFFFILTSGFAQNSHGHANTAPTQQQIDSVLKATKVATAHAQKFGSLVIQDAGRMKPLNTFSSELLRKMSKKDTYKDLSADQVFLSMVLQPQLWYHIDFIYVDKKNDSIRAMLGVPKGKKYLKATDFFTKDGQYKLAPYLEKAYATNTPNKFEQDFKKIDQRLGLLNRALSGEILKLFPLPADTNNKWVSAIEHRTDKSLQVKDSLYSNFINNGVHYYTIALGKALKTKDYTRADKLVEAFKQNQKNNAIGVLPSDKKVAAEIAYNKYDIFKKLFSWYMYVGTLMFLFLIFQIFKSSKGITIAVKTSKILVFVLFIAHTLGLIVRWYISGHAPWSDAYESMIYVAWATMGMGLLFAKKSDLTVAATAFVASMILMIAHWQWMDPAIANLQPVLNSYWLMIHVSIIVGSYGPFTLGMILGIVALLLMLLTTTKNKAKMDIAIQELTIINELSLTVGLAMLTIGNFLGGQWANESWGRYWGWDPKETWALVSIMVYAFVLHMRLVPGLRGKWTYNFMSIVAYASILMTYFGVNFYLTGLHSYASGDKVITPNFVYYSVAFVFILGIFSFWRYKKMYRK